MNKIIISAFICICFAISGCSSSGTSTYGSSPSALASQKEDALATAKKSAKEAKSLQRQLRKSNRALTRLERKLKRAKAKSPRHAKLSAQIKEKTREIKKLTSDARKVKRKADRAKSRANRLETRYLRAVELAEKRKAREADKEIAGQEEKRSSFAAANIFSDPTQKYIGDYNAKNDGGFSLPAIPVAQVNKKFLRQEVRYFTSHKAGTLVVNTRERHLYLVQSGGKAIRYGIGVGKAGFEWEGEASIAWKKAWPTWTPPEEMIARTPRLAKFSAENGGQPAGLKNPLGARALYIFKDGKDTLFRVHGTPAWASIGTASSSGCIRMMNQDVIDLYSRVRNGAKIIVEHS